MHTRFRRTGALVGAGAVVFGALAVVAGNQADAQQPAPTPIDQLLGQELQGKAALSKVQTRLAELSERNGIPAAKLQQILATDKTSWLDKDGKLFYREPVSGTKQAAAPSRAGPPRRSPPPPDRRSSCTASRAPTGSSTWTSTATPSAVRRGTPTASPPP